MTHYLPRLNELRRLNGKPELASWRKGYHALNTAIIVERRAFARRMASPADSANGLDG